MNIMKYCGINFSDIIKIIVSLCVSSLFLPKVFLCLADRYFCKNLNHF